MSFSRCPYGLVALVGVESGPGWQVLLDAAVDARTEVQLDVVALLRRRLFGRILVQHDHHLKQIKGKQKKSQCPQKSFVKPNKNQVSVLWIWWRYLGHVVEFRNLADVVHGALPLLVDTLRTKRTERGPHQTVAQRPWPCQLPS